MKPNKLELRVIQILVLAALLILGIRYFDVLISALGKLWSVVLPLLVGAAIAFTLNIPMKKLEKHYFPNSDNKYIRKSRRPVCLLLSVILILLAAAFIIRLVIPELINAFSLIIREVIAYLQMGQEWLTENSEAFPSFINQFIGQEVDIRETVQRLMNIVLQGVSGILGSAVSVFGSLAGIAMDTVFAVIFALYLLFGKEKLLSQLKRLCRRYLGPVVTLRIGYVLRIFNVKFQNFIIGQCVEALILGVLCTIGMLVFRFPYALMVGATISATALIPILGAYLGAAIGAFMIFTESPLRALGFLVFIVVLQQLEGNLIYPKTVGSSIGLPGIWVIAAVTIGGGLAGIPGMLVGVPLAAAIYQMISDDVHRGERKAAAAHTKSDKIPADAGTFSTGKNAAPAKAAEPINPAEASGTAADSNPGNGSAG